MGTLNLEIVLLFLISISICTFIIIEIYKYNRVAKLEKRINKYSINPINNNYISIFDKLFYKFKIIIKDISNILNNSIIIKNYSKRYKKYLEYSKEEKVKPMDYVSIKVVIILFLICIAAISNIYRLKSFTFIQFFVIFIVGFFSTDIILYIQEKRRKKQIEDDVLKAIIIMNSAFKSGRTTMQAIEIVKNELTGPIGEEFKKMYIDISFGLSLDVVFERFSKRIDNDDVKYITASLTILNKTGGDIVKVFSSIEKSLFNRKKLKNEYKTLTASSDVMFKFLLVIPFVFFFILLVLNPSYFTPLISSKKGLVLCSIIIIIYVSYIYIIKKVMKIKV